MPSPDQQNMREHVEIVILKISQKIWFRINFWFVVQLSGRKI